MGSYIFVPESESLMKIMTDKVEGKEHMGSRVSLWFHGPNVVDQTWYSNVYMQYGLERSK